MNKKFITFGSHDNYIQAAERLVSQSKKLNIFTETILYTPEFLQKDLEFWNKHGEFINKNKKGYGYWIWKSFIIKKTMGSMKDGDILLYLDCGCELDSKIRMRLLECIDIVKRHKIIGTYASLEKEWCKMDLIQQLQMNKPNYLNTLQRQGGAILFLVCEETRKFVNEWYTLCCDYHNIDDTPSILENLEGFKEHRHDQSIFSLLTKKYNLFSSRTLSNAVYYIRNKTGESKISI
jgi:hypothetical protein